MVMVWSIPLGFLIGDLDEDDDVDSDFTDG